MMNAKASVPKRFRLLLACVALATFAFASTASADVVRIHFSGLGSSGYADLTLGDAAADDSMFDPDRPPMAITGASGSFDGIAITGVRPLNNWPTPKGETLPKSFSLFEIPGYKDGGVSYNNLFYPLGSPLVCIIDGKVAYPFSGGFLDLMGVMFVLDGDRFLDLWSYGVTAPGFFGPDWPGGLAYGMKLIQRTPAGDYAVLPGSPLARAAIPEPGFLWLFGAGLLGLFAWRRSTEARKRTAKTLA